MGEHADEPCCTPGIHTSAIHADARAYRPAFDERRLDGQVLIPAGTFQQGDAFREGYDADGEAPTRLVTLPAHHLNATTVTNAEFTTFVDATGYRTDAERFGSSSVTAMALCADPHDVLRRTPGAPWWLEVRAADWRHPQGRHSTITRLADHPVVHVSWADAQAFCRWAGQRLPTEAEWEHGARGGFEARRFPWGDDLLPEGEWLCNIWQGEFPVSNTAEDGFETTAPVRSYPANGHGLYEVSGNVWEWCADSFSPTAYRDGPTEGFVLDHGQAEPATRVLRGGSFMCHDSYCHRYRVAARSRATPNTSASNVGFRCANDA